MEVSNENIVYNSCLIPSQYKQCEDNSVNLVTTNSTNTKNNSVNTCCHGSTTDTVVYRRAIVLLQVRWSFVTHFSPGSFDTTR